MTAKVTNLLVIAYKMRCRFDYEIVGFGIADHAEHRGIS